MSTKAKSSKAKTMIPTQRKDISVISRVVDIDGVQHPLEVQIIVNTEKKTGVITTRIVTKHISYNADVWVATCEQLHAMIHDAGVALREKLEELGADYEGTLFQNQD